MWAMQCNDFVFLLDLSSLHIIAYLPAMLSMFPKLAAVRASIEIPASGKQASGTDGALTMHLAAPEGSIGGYCIVCGDPDRVPKIGSMLTDGK